MAAARRHRRLPGIRFEARAAAVAAGPAAHGRRGVRRLRRGGAAARARWPVEDAARLRARSSATTRRWPGTRERGEPAPAQLGAGGARVLPQRRPARWVVRVASARRERSPLRAARRCSSAAPDGALRPAPRRCARARGSWADDAARRRRAARARPRCCARARATLLAFELATGAAALAPGDLLRIAPGAVHAVRRRRRGPSDARLPPSASPAVPGRTLVTVLGEPATALWLERAAPPYGATAPPRYLDRRGREQRSSPACRRPTIAAGLAAGRRRRARARPRRRSRRTRRAPGTLVAWRDRAAPRALWLRVDDASATASPARVTRARPAAVGARRAPDPRPAPGSAATPVERLDARAARPRRHRRTGALDRASASRPAIRATSATCRPTSSCSRRATPLLGPQPSLWADAAAPRFPLAGGERRRRASTRSASASCPTASAGRCAAARRAARPRRARRRSATRSSSTTTCAPTGLGALGGERRLHPLAEPEPRAADRHPRAARHRRGDDRRRARRGPARAGRRRSAVDGPAAPPTDEPPAPPRPPRDVRRLRAARARRRPRLDAPVRATAAALRAELERGRRAGRRAYELQEGTDPRGWDGAATLYTGRRAHASRLHGRTAGTHFYRVRAEAGPNVSPWSNGVAVARRRRRAATRSTPRRHYEPPALLAVQRALLRMCAARGDLLAVLSLPAHYRERAAIAHAAGCAQRDVAAPCPADRCCRSTRRAARARLRRALPPVARRLAARARGGPRATPPDGDGRRRHRAPRARRAAPGSRPPTSRCAT